MKPQAKAQRAPAEGCEGVSGFHLRGKGCGYAGAEGAEQREPVFFLFDSTWVVLTVGFSKGVYGIGFCRGFLQRFPKGHIVEGSLLMPVPAIAACSHTSVDHSCCKSACLFGGFFSAAWSVRVYLVLRPFMILMVSAWVGR